VFFFSFQIGLHSLPAKDLSNYLPSNQKSDVLSTKLWKCLGKCRYNSTIPCNLSVLIFQHPYHEYGGNMFLWNIGITCKTTHCWHKTTIRTFTTMKTWNSIVWFYYFNRSWDRFVGTVICYRLDNWDLIPGRVTIFFFSPQCWDWLWAPPKLLLNGYRVAHSLGVKGLRFKAIHLPPSSTKVKNGAPIPPLVHMSSWCGA
jgi:hypothetical protein